jgi:hypothetical protein
MSPRMAYVVLAASVAAGCASSPQVDESVATAAPTLAAASSSAATGSASVVPDAVIDANDLIANTPARPVCREMLRPNSNVRTKYCMSAEDWKTYERAEAQRAGELVRTWQGGDYR